MPERAYNSRHISMKQMKPQEVDAVLADILLFNQIMHKACCIDKIKDSSDRKPTGRPDLRKKENKNLKTDAPKSAHLVLKETYHADDYFTNSAVNTAKASIQSVKELNQRNIDEAESQLKDLRKKRTSVKRTQTRIQKIKTVLIRASRSQKKHREPSYEFKSMFESYDPESKSFLILSGKKVLRSYANVYLFEVQYVDPKLRWCRHALKLFDEKEDRLNSRISEMKKFIPGICFGSKKLFHQQYGMKYPDHQTWLSVFRKKRSHTLSISGRKDASQGNFLFRYDKKTHTLYYKTQQRDTSGKRIIAEFPDVIFPYGQDKVDAAVSAAKSDRRAVAWRIITEGQSFRIQAMVNVQPEHMLNDYYKTGCIAMDTNYDNLSIADLDGCGNVLRHRVIRFNLENASSGHAEQILSKALDEVFSWCDESKKPFAMENLSLKHVSNHYGPKRLNFVASRFAFSKVTTLADSKALKHCVDLCKVNPAYTSQAGKLLFAKKYGCSIHEGASIAIGRRALGIHERLPAAIRRELKPIQQTLPRQKQWKAAYPITKKIVASDIYQYRFA